MFAINKIGSVLLVLFLELRILWVVRIHRKYF